MVSLKSVGYGFHVCRVISLDLHGSFFCSRSKWIHDGWPTWIPLTGWPAFIQSEHRGLFFHNSVCTLLLLWFMCTALHHVANPLLLSISVDISIQKSLTLVLSCLSALPSPPRLPPPPLHLSPFQPPLSELNPHRRSMGAVQWKPRDWMNVHLLASLIRIP